MPITRHHAASALLGTSLVALVASPHNYESPKYAVKDLGTLGGTVSITSGINAHAQVVGTSFLAGDDSLIGFVTQGNEMCPVASLGGEVAQATAVNDNGTVVGVSQLPNSENVHAFVSSGNKTTDIGTLGGENSLASGINDGGVVVGLSQTSDDETVHGFRYENGKMRELLPKSAFSAATDINDAGQIAGYFATRLGGVTGFVWYDGKVTNIKPVKGQIAAPIAISNRGQVVGIGSTGAKDEYHAFSFQNNRVTNLGSLGGSISQAYDVNNAGQIVGLSYLPGDEMAHGFLVENDGKMVDLNTRLESGGKYEIVFADGINDAGQIAATGIVGGERIHALRLDPVRGSALKPGAASLLLLAIAGAFVVGCESIRRRRG